MISSVKSENSCFTRIQNYLSLSGTLQKDGEINFKSFALAKDVTIWETLQSNQVSSNKQTNKQNELQGKKKTEMGNLHIKEL